MKISKLIRLFIVSFAVLSAVSIALTLVSGQMNRNAQTALESQAEFRRLGLQLQDASDFLTQQAQAYVQYGEQKYYDAYMNEVNVAKNRDGAIAGLTGLGAPQNELALVSEAGQLSNTLAELETRAFEAVDAGDLETARSLMFGAEYDAGKAPIVEKMAQFQDTMNTRAGNEVRSAESLANVFQILAAVGMLLSALVGILGLILIYRRIKPINKLVRIVGDIIGGNANVNLDQSLVTKDEIGELAGDMYKLVGMIKQMVEDLSSIDSEVNVAGDIDYRIDESKYNGSYRDMVASVNKFIDQFIKDILEFTGALTDISGGNFDVHIRQMPGKKALLNQELDSMSSELKQINTEILMLTQGAIKGDLNVRADAEQYAGGWKELLHNLNSLVNTVADRAHWYESILDAIPFPVSVTNRDMKWTFINKATESFLGKSRGEVAGQPCSNWGAAICNTQNCGIACAKRGVSQTTFQQGGMDFQVDVASLKNIQGADVGYVEVVQDISKLENVIRQINGVMQNTKVVSEQVSEGAKQISESSQQLASGASNQASAIEELNASIETINTQTQVTAQNAQSASELSKRAQENAIKGNDEMTRMVSSMEGIKSATANIAKIINTIESIAFQTNLLALNASVEAARAGEHGKGFSVVADEVRTLAGHSKQAAQETNDLISDTTSKVDEGTEIALSTARSFKEIVNDFENVSKIIHDIASASSEQAESIDQVGIGISQIANITQANSATSEEAAAASQQLASQSETLINMFKDM